VWEKKALGGKRVRGGKKDSHGSGGRKGLLSSPIQKTERKRMGKAFLGVKQKGKEGEGNKQESKEG